MELGDPTSDAASDAREKFCMKDGRVPLGKIVRGAKVSKRTTINGLV